MKQSAILATVVVSGWFGLIQSQEPRSRNPQRPAKVDTVEVQRLVDKLTDALDERIDSPAVVVFQNIQLFKRLTARRLLGMMRGWTRTFGVGCDHCHTIDQWDKDDKLPKQTARAMEKMEDDVNALIKGVSTIQDERAHVNCWTCHRGSPKPETTPPWVARRPR